MFEEDLEELEENFEDDSEDGLEDEFGDEFGGGHKERLKEDSLENDPVEDQGF